MGICLSLYKPNKDSSEVNVASLKSPSQKGGRKLKRIKTKFPKKGKNASDDDDEEEKEKENNKKEENKSNEDNNNNK